MSSSIRRIKAKVQYDGTGFLGFQRQSRGRTVQGVLEESLSRVLGEKIVVKAAGRTDAGVHARGQVISFVTASSIPADRIPLSTRGMLPDDVAIVEAEEVPLSFDPQKDAVRKTYCYRVWRGTFPDLFWSRYSYAYPGDLDFSALQEEAASLLGTHDFRSFMATGSSAKTTVRRVTRAEWVRKRVDDAGQELWEFWISADGFLYRMVRLIVGTLIDVARGRLERGVVRRALECPGLVEIGPCVPGKGLCLEEVIFT